MTPTAMAKLHALCFTTPRPWSADEFAALLDSPFTFVLTEADGFLVGRVIAGEAELLTLAVAPDQRRHGLGTRLVQAFCHEATKRGAESAFLEVSQANPAACALYAAQGFVAKGRRKAYYHRADGPSEDALILVRSFT